MGSEKVPAGGLVKTFELLEYNIRSVFQNNKHASPNLFIKNHIPRGGGVNVTFKGIFYTTIKN